MAFRSILSLLMAGLLLVSCGFGENKFRAETYDRNINRLLGRDDGGGTTTSQNPSAPDSAKLRRLVDGTVPAESISDQEDRYRNLLRRLDSQYASRISFDFDDPADPDWVTDPPTCSGTRCTITWPNGDNDTWDSNSSTWSPGATILSRNGVTIEQYWRHDIYSFGSVLHHSAFTSAYSKSGDGFSVRASSAIGDLAGSRPVISGVWRGMMSGVLIHNDELLLGDTVLEYSVSGSGGSLHAEFTNIVNVSRNQAYSVPSISFHQVPVRSNGTFHLSDSFSRIEGGFYGSSHSETSGVFESSGILGAFGALEQ